MSRGGVETWLMHVLRNIDPDRFEMHFFVNSNKEGAYDREISALGGQVHYGGHPQNPLQYAREFASVVRDHGPFDVLHTHVYWYSGIVVWLGLRAGIPIRIAHSHTASGAPIWKLHRRGYQLLMQSLIKRYATHRIAVSQRASEGLFGAEPKRPFTLLYYGMDYARFLHLPPKAEARQKLGIPAERKVIGHIGRFVAVKNHVFILEFLARLLAEGVDAHLLLVGDGPLLPVIEEQIRSKNLASRCTLAGSHADVVPFFSAMDVFVLPSLWEGLPLVSLESQAAGVPLIASTAVPGEIVAIPELVERIPLSSGAGEWARALGRRLEEPFRRRGDEPIRLEQSQFGLPSCLHTLSGIYSGNVDGN